MDSPFYYEIRIEGHLSADWSDWLEGLNIINETDHATLICGEFVDQAALMGILTKLHALNLTLMSVNRKS